MADLDERIHDLKVQRDRLASLDDPEQLCLPPAARSHMSKLASLRLDERHVSAIRDGWILAYALTPDLAAAVLPSRVPLLNDADHVEMLRGLDDIIDADADDPRIDDLADTGVDLATRMTMVSDVAEFASTLVEVVELLA